MVSSYFIAFDFLLKRYLVCVCILFCFFSLNLVNRIDCKSLGSLGYHRARSVVVLVVCRVS